MAAAAKVRCASHVDPIGDGTVRASFVVQQGRKAAILCLQVDPGGDEVGGGSAVLPASAIALPPADLFAMVDREPMAPWECRALGLYGDGPGAVADAFLGFASGRAPDGASVPESPLDRRYGVARPLPPSLAGLDGRRPVPGGARAGESSLPGHRFYPDRLPGQVRAWIDRVRGHVQGPAGIWFLSPDAWTERVSAWLADTSGFGERRRQAGRLHCGFAPVLAAEPTISRAIDEGRPFEPELLRIAREWLPEELRDRLDLPRLRRMRGVDFAGMDRMASLLAVAARMPLNLLPAPGEAPRELAWAIGGALEAIDRMGLGLDTLLSAPMPGWLQSQETGKPAGHRYDRLRTALGDALDMATALSRDLVEPLMEDWRYRGAALDRRGFECLAGRFLFEGLPLARVMEASKRWHDDLGRLREAADSGIPDLRWPALFEPFECGNGVSVTCLTTAQELDDEGGRGHDIWTGMEGLSHCVGGYAEDCYAGDVHVASVRQGGRRLSTVAFRLNARDGRLAVSQHKGRRNADPDAAAVDGLRRFMTAHAWGEVRLNPAALEMRGDPEPGPATPEAALGRAHAAWRPHLRQGAESALALEACLADLLRKGRPEETAKAA